MLCTYLFNFLWESGAWLWGLPWEEIMETEFPNIYMATIKNPKPPAPKVRIQLTNFSFVHNRKSAKKMVRFRYAMTVDHPKYGRLGDMLDGCLLTSAKDGEIYWSPPKGNNFGSGKTFQNAVVTPDTYKLVLDLLEGAGYTKHVGQDPKIDFKYRELLQKDPQIEHPELPVELGAEE